MSKLNQALAKKGLSNTSSKSKEKKTSMVTVACDDSMRKKIDRYLDLEKAVKDNKSELELVSSSIREKATEYIVKNHETENLIFEGTKDSINVNVKDQYNVISDADSLEEMTRFLKKRKINPDSHITEESRVSFDFNKLSDKEQEKLINFLSNELGAERMEQVVTTKTTYKLSDIKNVMIQKCKTVEEFEEFRSISSHHNMTIARRK